MFKIGKMNAKNTIFGLIFILLIISIIMIPRYFNSHKPIYGNDELGIVTAISKDEAFNNKDQIEIYKITNIGTNRLVGYFYNNLTCIANFVANEKGNYVLVDKQWTGKPIQQWLSNFSGEGYEYRKIVVGYNGKGNLCKIKVQIHGNYAPIEVDVKPDKADIIVINLEDVLKDKNNYSYAIEYYDSNGNTVN